MSNIRCAVIVKNSTINEDDKATVFNYLTKIQKQKNNIDAINELIISARLNYFAGSDKIVSHYFNENNEIFFRLSASFDGNKLVFNGHYRDKEVDEDELMLLVADLTGLPYSIVRTILHAL